MKSMQTQLKLGDVTILALFIGVWASAICGCAVFSKTATSDQKLAQTRNLAYAAASIGTREALLQNPTWLVRFAAAEKELDRLLTQKAITGDLLRGIIADLPVKELKSEQARIAIESVTVLFDSSVGTSINIESQPYLVAAASGIRDGIKIAIGP